MPIQYWWVNQRKTYKVELKGNFLWLPKTEKDGRRNETYNNMEQIIPGDIIFSYCKKEIKTISKDRSFYIEAAHIEGKALKGTESPSNILILCPNHHKEFDYGDRCIIEHTDKHVVFTLNGLKHNINLEIEK